ncbi:MAG: hypothetical protein ACOYI2_01925 [Bacillota bacterium]|jgi:hypothetical protein
MTTNDMEFAPLSSGDLKKIQDIENQLNTNQGKGSEIILLAYTKRAT